MKIIETSCELLFPTKKETIEEMLMNVEKAARLCYKSEGNMGETYNASFIRSKIDMGHLSVVEHSLVTFKVTCDRGVSHELVRHRLASFSQESTRYCNYNNERFGSEINVIDIREIMKNEIGKKAIVNGVKDTVITAEHIFIWINTWLQAMEDSEKHYKTLIENGCPPQLARSVLPNSLKTEIIISMNFRELRHFFQLRAVGTTGKPHPQMLQFTVPMLGECKQMFPVMFDDINIKAV